MKLESLYLNHNVIGDPGIEAVAEVYPGCKQLVKISLTSNNISDTGVNALARAMNLGDEENLDQLLVIAGNDRISNTTLEALSNTHRVLFGPEETLLPKKPRKRARVKLV